MLGSTAPKFGAHARFRALKARGVLSRIPDDLPFDVAVALADGALTALPFVRDVAALHAGQSILVNGAAGSVGAAAVQIAHHLGAEVTGVCSTRSLDLVAALGADHVVDRTQVDLTEVGRRYDVVFDAVGRSSFSHCRAILEPDGRYLTTVPSLAIMRQMLTTRFTRQRARIAFTGLDQTPQRLDDVLALAASGRLQPVIDRTHPLEEIVEAHRYVDTGRKAGSVVIEI